jgi:hypothetical protein
LIIDNDRHLCQHARVNPETFISMESVPMSKNHLMITCPQIWIYQKGYMMILSETPINFEIRCNPAHFLYVHVCHNHTHPFQPNASIVTCQHCQGWAVRPHKQLRE